MENSRASHNNDMQLMSHAVLGNFLQTPVPIVVVVIAKELSALANFPPGGSVECHAHVVFAAHPWC